ncbi:4085_t:CDS:10 [Entrophospora sp. SA101]|nr:4080_t:CDS:10 [Entrophospora sp. SA101]CAJ0883488.1 4085_t:CDS:10 [Entrophospora sp. SA101]
MLVRLRSKEGTVRMEVDPNEDVTSLGEKIAKQYNLSDLSTIAISDRPTTSQPIIQLAGQTLSQIGLSCKHAGKGMCDYCMPLEPYDTKYLSEKGIKHMSFYAYLRKINKQNKQQQNMKFIPPLEEPDFKVKTNCSSGHAPWPEGICTKCQPSAVTLQLQQYRMVDHVEFSVSSLINDFINFWRSTGYQRFGYLYGRYESYPDVPLGVKAVVEAIYEPPQEDEVNELSLTLPWNEESLIDEVAAECGLTKVGMIYTDLVDDGTGQGKVICKRHIDSYFLSSQECCFSATMQNKHPTHTKWCVSKQFDSRFVTCVVTGNENGDIDVSSYQVSNTCAAMVSADIIEPSVDPSIMRVKESTSKRYVPEVFYNYKNKYGIEVKESAKPSFPVEYLLVNTFPIANRSVLETQDLRNLHIYLGSTSSEDIDNELLSNFQLLTYIKSTDILDQNDFSSLVKCATSHEPNDAVQLAINPGWQTLLAIMREKYGGGNCILHFWYLYSKEKLFNLKREFTQRLKITFLKRFVLHW